jgi:hypothetical protein
MMVLGVGALVANTVCPYLLQQTFTHDGVTDFRALFLVPMFTALVAAISLALFFHPPPRTKTAAAIKDDAVPA